MIVLTRRTPTAESRKVDDNRGRTIPGPASPPRSTCDPCGELPDLTRDRLGRLDGRQLVHVACPRCDHDWWELDGHPAPFGEVSDLLAADGERLTRRH